MAGGHFSIIGEKKVCRTLVQHGRRDVYCAWPSKGQHGKDTTPRHLERLYISSLRFSEHIKVSRTWCLNWRLLTKALLVTSWDGSTTLGPSLVTSVWLESNNLCYNLKLVVVWSLTVYTGTIIISCSQASLYFYTCFVFTFLHKTQKVFQ